MLDHLIELQVLDLHSNNITGLKKETIWNNMKLKSLRVDGNNLRSLDSDLFENTPLLETLFLNNTNLLWIHQDIFKGLNRLEEVMLHDNKIRFLPRYLFKESKFLSRLDVHGNHLQYLPKDMFMELEYLRFLDLRDNRFLCTCMFVNSFNHVKSLKPWKKEFLRGNCMTLEKLVELNDHITCHEQLNLPNELIIDRDFQHEIVLFRLRNAIKKQYFITLDYRNIQIQENIFSLIKFQKSPHYQHTFLDKELFIKGIFDNQSFEWKIESSDIKEDFIEIVIVKDIEYNRFFIVRNGNVVFMIVMQ